jgi:hypothetical protein
MIRFSVQENKTSNFVLISDFKCENPSIGTLVAFEGHTDTGLVRTTRNVKNTEYVEKIDLTGRLILPPFIKS